MKAKITLLFVFISSFLFSQNRKVLFIGLDGTMPAAITAANAPNLHALLAHSKYSYDAVAINKTWSANGWGSLFTGVEADKHGAQDNSFSGSNFGSYPSFLTRIESFNPALRTVSFCQWSPIHTTIVAGIDSETTLTSASTMKNNVVTALNTTNPDVLSVVFDDVDLAGHTYGFDPANANYRAQLAVTDGHVGEVLTAMRNRPNFANEDWLVLVSTDHGGTGTGHGGGLLEERRIFTIVHHPNLGSEETPKIVSNNTLTYNQNLLAANTHAKPAISPLLNFGATQDFSIEFWVKPTLFPTDAPMISNKNWNSGGNDGFVISAFGGNIWNVNIGDGTNRRDVRGGKLVANQWIHLAVTFDRDGFMTLYENGVIVARQSLVGIGDINNALPFVINQDGTTTYGSRFSGTYKDIRVWNTVITPQVLVQWANQDLTASHPNYSNLILNYKCDETSGSTFVDSSPNALNATIVGTNTRTLNQTSTFTILDCNNTPRQPDIAVTALNWMCVPINPAWNLDGRGIVDYCETILSSDDFSTKNTITLYPNPTNGLINLTFDSSYTNVTFEVYDVLGKKVINRFENAVDSNYSLDLSSLSNGVYNLIVLSNNDRIISKKIIKN